jgi:hypothetical protein
MHYGSDLAVDQQQSTEPLLIDSHHADRLSRGYRGGSGSAGEERHFTNEGARPDLRDDGIVDRDRCLARGNEHQGGNRSLQR